MTSYHLIYACLTISHLTLIVLTIIQPRMRILVLQARTLTLSKRQPVITRAIRQTKQVQLLITKAQLVLLVAAEIIGCCFRKVTSHREKFRPLRPFAPPMSIHLPSNKSPYHHPLRTLPQTKTVRLD